jgi:ATPase subunit of ABC transporter with duplicated ATPase domains
LLLSHNRYGFILERYTESIAKHYLHFFNNSFESISSNIQRWNEIAATREMVAASSSAEGTIVRRINHAEATVSGTLKRDNEQFSSRRNLERASLSLSDESESNLSINNKNDLESARPHYSMDKLSSGSGNRVVVAVYGYSATQENQLSFAEGDKICLIGDNISG